MAKQKSEAKKSITAIATAKAAFICGKEEKWKNLVKAETAELLEFFTSEAIAKYPSYLAWGLIKVVEQLPFYLQHFALDKMVAADYATHIAIRKLMIEQQVIKAIDEKTTQVVIPGAGLSTLAVELSKIYKNIKFFEIDHGETSNIKQECLEKLKNLPASHPLAKYGQDCSNIHFIDSDLSTHPLSVVLLNNGFDPQQKTIVVAEGLTMYLDEDAVKMLLQQVNELIKENDGSFIVSFKGRNDPESFFSRLLRRDSGEDYKYILPAENVPATMKDFGFIVKEKALFTYLQKQTGNFNATLPRENYFLLKPAPQEQIKPIPIVEVPNINIQLVKITREEGCHIL